MSVFTGLEVYRGVASVFCDGVRLCSVRKKHFDLIPLTAGQEFDPDEWMDRIASLQSAEAYESALTRLDSAERTADTLRRALIRSGYLPRAAEAAVSRLTENGLVDDRRYAERIIKSSAEKGEGFFALRRKLASKGFERALIETLTEETDPDRQAEGALACARGLFRRYSVLPAAEARRKLSAALARRGYSWDTVTAVIDSLFSGEEDES